MKDGIYIPNIIDFAYQVIDLHEENCELKRKVKHLEAINQILSDGQRDSMKHNEQMTAGIVMAAIGDTETAREILSRETI